MGLSKHYRWQQLQLALQFAAAVALASLPVFIRAIYFPLACLAGIFVVLLHVLLVGNHHVGTLLLSSANMLGAVWPAVAAAGVMVSVTIQIPSHAAHLVVLALLASVGFALFCIVKVAPGPARLPLQGTNLLLLFSISLVLSVSASSTTYLWLSLSHIMLIFAIAAAASTAAGVLVLPSLATDAAVGLAVQALRKTGNTATMCVSILLRPEHVGIPGVYLRHSVSHRSLTDVAARQDLTAAVPEGGCAIASSSCGSNHSITDSSSGGRQEATAAPHKQQATCMAQACTGVATAAAAAANSKAGHPGPPSPFQGHAYSAAAAPAGSAADEGGVATVVAGMGAPDITTKTCSSDSSSLAEDVSTDTDNPPQGSDAFAPAVAAAGGVAAASAGECSRSKQLHNHAPPTFNSNKAELLGSVFQGHSSNNSSPHAAAAVAAAAAAAHSPAGRGSLEMSRRGSLVIEESHRLSSQASSELEFMTHVTRPGQWGIRSYIMADAVSAASLRDLAADGSYSSVGQGSALGFRGRSKSHLSNASQKSAVGVAAASAAAAPARVSSMSAFGSVLHSTSRTSSRHHSMTQDHQHPHKRSQHQQQQQLDAQQQHLFVRLGRGVDQIRPLLSELKGLHDAVSVEQLWWVRLAVGLNPGDALGVLHMQGWGAMLEALESLLNRVAALEGMLEGGPGRTSLSKLAAYKALRNSCGIVVAQAAALCANLSLALEATFQLQQQLLLGQVAAAVVQWGRCSFSSKKAPLPLHDSRHNKHLSHSGAAAGHASCVLGAFDWEVSRQQLLGVLHYEHQHYYADLAAADRNNPFKLDPAGGVQGLMFLSILALGVVDAAQRLQSAGQAVLGVKSTIVAAAGRHEAGGVPAAVTAAGGPDGAVSSKRSSDRGSGACSSSSSSSDWLLLDVFLCISVWKCLHQALRVKLPQLLRQPISGVSKLLQQRRFQAGLKVWLALSIALMVIILLSVWQPTLPSNLIMLGLIALLYCMKERVESSTEMVMIRVFSTVLGACIGELLMFHPSSAQQPWGLALSLICFAFILSPLAATQFKLMLCLGLMNLNAVVLCQYTGCCGSHGTTSYFLGRILATGGGALLAVVLNRALWPWRRDQWASEQMVEVLELALSAARALYDREYQFVSDLTGNSAGSGYGIACGAGRSTEQARGDAHRTAIAAVGLAAKRHRVSCELCQDHIVISVPTSQTAGADAVTPSVAAAATAALPSSPRTNQQQQGAVSDIRQQQQRMQVLLGPVQTAVARDTVMQWKWTQLAIPKVVPLMLSAVQQLTEALAALKVTADLAQHQQQQAWIPTAASPAPPASAVAAPVTHPVFTNGGGGQHADSAVADVSTSGSPVSKNWRSVLLYDELEGQLHGSMVNILDEMNELVVLVRQTLRKPTESNKRLLQQKIDKIHKLRVAFTATYVALRNQRHTNLRSLFTALMQHQELVQRLKALQEPSVTGTVDAGVAEAEVVRDIEQDYCDRTNTNPAGAELQRAAGASAASIGDQQALGSPRCEAGSTAAQPALAADKGSAGTAQGSLQQQVKQEIFLSTDPAVLQMDLAIVQYTAFVYALRRVLHRGLAVARCVAEAD